MKLRMQYMLACVGVMSVSSGISILIGKTFGLPHLATMALASFFAISGVEYLSNNNTDSKSNAKIKEEQKTKKHSP